jgi:hypothetical protein
MAVNYQADNVIVFGKVESTPGTIEIPSATDINCRVQFTGTTMSHEPVIDDEAGKVANVSGATEPSLVGQKIASISFTHYVSAKANIQDAPEDQKFLEACAYKGAAITTVGYKMENNIDNFLKTISLYCEYIDVATGDRLRMGIYGASGVMTESADNVGIVRSYTFTGKLMRPLDIPAATALDAVTNLPTTARIKFPTCTLVTVAGEADERIISYSFDSGNKVVKVANQACTTSDYAGTTLVAGAGQTGSTLAVDGFTATTGTIYKGDHVVVDISGTNYEFIITADAAISGNAATLSIYPALPSSPDDDAVISFKDRYHTGIDYFIVKREDEARLTITPYQKAYGDFSPLNNLINQTEGSTLINAENNNHIISIPRSQIIAVSGTDSEGIKTNDITIKPLRNGTTDSDVNAESSVQFLNGAYS